MQLLRLTCIIIFLSYVCKDCAEAKVNNITPPVEFFVGREAAIKQIEDYLTKFNKATIVGMSGIGKTQIIRQYARQQLREYDIIWYFNMQLDFNEQCSALAKKINTYDPEAQLSIEHNLAATAITEYLSGKERWLLIFDQLKINQNKKIKDIIDWQNNGHIIFGSQDADSLPGHIHLRYLNADDTKKAVNKILGNTNKKTLNLIMELSKGYPILLSHGSHFVKANREINIKDSYLLLDEQNKMDAYIAVLLDELTDSAKNLFLKAVLLTSNDFNIEVLQNIIQSNENFAADLQQLIRFNLILKTVSPSGETLEIHDIVRQSVVKNSDTDEIYAALFDGIKNFIHNVKTPHCGLNKINSNDRSIIRNLEVLINVASLYNLDKTIQLQLRLPIYMNYFANMNIHKCKEMYQWCQQNQAVIKAKIKDNNQDALYDYIYYLLLNAQYDFFIADNIKGAVAHLAEAKSLYRRSNHIKSMSVEILLYSYTAQFNYLNGDFKLAKESLDIVKEITNKCDVFCCSSFYYAYLAEYFLLQGKYNKALKNIEKSQIYVEQVPYNPLYSFVYILRAEINRINGNLNVATMMNEKIYKQESDLFAGQKAHIYAPQIFHSLTLEYLNKSDFKQAEYFNQKIFDAHRDKIISATDNLDIMIALADKAKIRQLQGNINASSKYRALANKVAMNRYKKQSKIPQYVLDIISGKI